MPELADSLPSPQAHDTRLLSSRSLEKRRFEARFKEDSSRKIIKPVKLQRQASLERPHHPIRKWSAQNPDTSLKLSDRDQSSTVRLSLNSQSWSRHARQKSDKDTHEVRHGILRALAPVSLPETEARHRTDSTLSSKQVSLGLNRDDEPWIRTLKYSESPT